MAHSKPTSSLPERKSTHLHLSTTAIRIIDLLRQKRGIGKTSVVEWALRDMAEKYDVRVEG